MRFVFALATCVLFLSASPAMAPAGSGAVHSPAETSLLRQINKIRASHGLHPLVASAQLARSADFHGQEMGRLGYFAHNSANGTSWDKRIQRFYPKPKSGWWMAGENLLFASGAVVITDAEAVRQWMESPDHRRNILEPRWRDIGIAEVFVPHAPGDFGGENTVLLVTDFGARH